MKGSRPSPSNGGYKKHSACNDEGTLPMPLLPITSPETVAQCASILLRPTDIFVCSYPKSGTTWTQHIVLSLILAARRFDAGKSSGTRNGGSDDEGRVVVDAYRHVSEFAPFFEIDAHWDLENGCLADSVRNNHDRLGRRVFNTHLRWDMLPKRSKIEDPDVTSEEQPDCGKFIYVTRSLPDVCASFYFHLSNQKEGTYTENFEHFFRDWMAGNIAFGSPVDHLLSFATGFGHNEYSSDGCAKGADGVSNQISAGQKPLLILSYEAMKNDLRAQVFRIMEFLNLSIPSNFVEEELLPTFEFYHMKANASKFQPQSVTWLNGFQFLRKGAVGSGRGLMNDDMEASYREWLQKKGYRERVSHALNKKDDEAMETLLQIVD